MLFLVVLLAFISFGMGINAAIHGMSTGIIVLYSVIGVILMLIYAICSTVVAVIDNVCTGTVMLEREKMKKSIEKESNET